MGPMYPRPPGGIPADLPIPPQVAGLVLRKAVEHLSDLDDDAADLTVAGGDQVAIVCIATVSDWLRGLVVRAEAGDW